MKIRSELLTLAIISSLATLGSGATSASALTIVRNFISPGNPLPGNGDAVAVDAPTNATGGGNLPDIFNAAADWWEMAILDDFTLALNYGWASLNFPVVGVQNLIAQGGTPNRETEGTIRFDNDIRFNDMLFPWFLDPTPDDNSEYNTFTEFEADLGGGTINVGRVYSNPNIAAAQNIDLLTVAKHEIGHALGLSSANFSYQNEAWPDNDIDITLPLINAGTVIPTKNIGTCNPPAPCATNFISNAHINAGQLPNALLVPTFFLGSRRLQSAADILANAQISQFTKINTSPHVAKVPEPTPTPLALGLVMGIGFFFLRGNKKNW